jgi:hypothetical protein
VAGKGLAFSRTAWAGRSPTMRKTINPKLCLHLADVCLLAAEREVDHNYRAMLLKLAKEWLIDAKIVQAPKKT